MKQSIINFYILNKDEGKKNAEALIEILLIAQNEDKIFILNQLNGQIMEEKDFYSKEETKKFLLFKLFFQKCYPIFINNEIEDGAYLLQ